MKKITALLLLLILSVETSCFAAEIVVGTDGQARYAGETKNPIVQDVSTERVKKRDSMSKNTISKKAEFDRLISPYQANNQSLVKKANKTIDYQAALKKAQKRSHRFLEYDYGSDRQKIKLLDGDYAIWYVSTNNEQYATEYHQNDAIMGVVKIKKLDNNSVVFYEYRSENPNAKTAALKHIMIAYNDTHAPVFIYTKDNKLRCCQYDGKTYAIDLPHLPEWQEIDLDNMKTANEEFSINSKEVAKETGMILAALPIMIVAAPVFWVILFGYKPNTPH